MSLSWSECKKNKEQELDIFSKLTNVIESKTIVVLVLSYFLESKTIYNIAYHSLT